MPLPRSARRPRRLPRAPRPLYPTDAERRYTGWLRGYVRRMHELLMVRLMPVLQRAGAVLQPPGDRGDAAGRLDDDDREIGAVESVFRALKEIRVEWQKTTPAGQIELFLRGTGDRIGETSRVSLQRIVKSVTGFDPLLTNRGVAARLAIFQRQNVELIRSIDERYFGEIEGIVSRGLGAGTRPETMASEIRERYGVSLSRANLIARDQTAKLHGQLDRIRQQDLGVTRYVWLTSKDERVRESHREHAGQIYYWSDPPAETGHPGEDYQCRCVAVPVLEDVLDELEQAA